MKTAEDVAKGIAYDIALCWCKEQHQQCDKADEIIPLIAQALTAFAEERVKEFYRGTSLYEHGRAEALEEAATVALDHDSGCSDEIAKRIRALKDKP